MPKVTEEHRQVRRQQIIEAALNCFAQKGFHQTTMRDICKEAKLSLGAVYLHFAGKEDIIEASWQSIWETRAGLFDEVKKEYFTLYTRNKLWAIYEKRLTHADTDRAWIVWIQLLAEALYNPRIRESIRRNWNDGEKNTVEMLRLGVES